MKALLLDPIANLGRLEDFPMIDQPRLCRRCNYRRRCFPRESVAPEPTPLLASTISNRAGR
jgi:hypothetical protein